MTPPLPGPEEGGPEVSVLRAADRYVTATGWGSSRHCFSFGEHYDPENVGLGPLVAHNEELLPPGAGFEPHEHRGVDVVTWVVDGELVHEDSAGHRAVVRPGVVQRMSAGRGVTHSERNDPSAAGPVRFVQAWVVPDDPDGEPGHELLDLTDRLAAGGLVEVASGPPADRSTGAPPSGPTSGAAGPAPARLGRTGAALLVARLDAGAEVDLPAPPRLHVFVVRGSLDVEHVGGLAEGDSARLTGVTAPLRVRASAEESELLVWRLP